MTEEVKRYSLKAGTNFGEWDLSLPLSEEVRANLEGMKMNEMIQNCDEEWARIQREENGVTEDEVEETEEEETPDPVKKSYAQMNNTELVAEVKGRQGLKVTGKPTRDDLIKLLEADDAKAE